MNRKIYVVAALVLAGARATAQSGSASGTSQEHADQAAAQQKAASTRPSEGAGGKDPHPVANGPEGDRQYSSSPATPSREQGRTNAGTSATAQGQAAAGQAQSPSAAAANEVSGRVALVNPADHELAIDSGSATTQVKVAPDAKITLDGKAASFKDIKQGASVRASLDRSGDEVQAKTVEVTSGAKKK